MDWIDYRNQQKQGNNGNDSWWGGLASGAGSLINDWRSGGQGITNWLGENQGTSNLNKDKNLLQLKAGQGPGPYINQQSPYAGQTGALLQMLQNRAQGGGPSLAGDAYNQASQDAMQRVLAASYGSNPGAQRAGLQQLGGINQGLANGYANARNQEIVGATGQYGQMLNQADSAQMLRDKANQEAWLKQMQEMFGADKAEAQQGKSNMGILGGFLQAIGGAGG